MVRCSDFWNGTYCHHCTESDVFQKDELFHDSCPSISFQSIIYVETG